jgi:hypothetical protein
MTGITLTGADSPRYRHAAPTELNTSHFTVPQNLFFDLFMCVPQILFRRLNKKDRIIYRIDDSVVLVYVISIKDHYGDK